LMGKVKAQVPAAPVVTAPAATPATQPTQDAPKAQ